MVFPQEPQTGAVLQTLGGRRRGREGKPETGCRCPNRNLLQDMVILVFIRPLRLSFKNVLSSSCVNSEKTWTTYHHVPSITSAFELNSVAVLGMFPCKSNQHSILCIWLLFSSSCIKIRIRLCNILQISLHNLKPVLNAVVSVQKVLFVELEPELSLLLWTQPIHCQPLLQLRYRTIQ